MVDPDIIDRSSWVSELQIEAPDLKQNLDKVATAIDTGFIDATPNEIAPFIRLASDELSKLVYFHCHGNLEDGGKATEANARFDQFEKMVGERSSSDRFHLKKLRSVFQAAGNLAVHHQQLSIQDVFQAFNMIMEYTGRWITQFAPLEHRKSTARRAPHVDEIAAYRARTEAKVIDLMGAAPVSCYLTRKVRFRLLQRRTEPEHDDDPLGWEVEAERRDARDDALPGDQDTSEPLKTHLRSLLTAQAGTGKSLEAMQLAVRLTCVNGVDPLACCLALECKRLEPSDTPINGAFVPADADESEMFRKFCTLRGWRRYLILDGFDEIKKNHWTNEEFYQAVIAIQVHNPDVHVLITSREVPALGSTFLSSWKAYELLEFDEHGVANYLYARVGHRRNLLQDFGDQWDSLDKHDSIRRLLMRPFFLSAFSETLKSGDQIRNLGRRQIVERFTLELLSRQRKKATDKDLAEGERERILEELDSHAFHTVTNAVTPGKVVDYLAGLDLLLRPDDKQFKQSAVRDYLAARYLFRNSSNACFDLLRSLEDEHRFALHGWLLEFVNDEHLETVSKTFARNRLWLDDPVLVGLGLFSEAQLMSLDLPVRPWEPYEVGLLRILRGEGAATIPETSEIRDVRLSSPGEKLLHRLSHPDLPYLIRAVPSRRALVRLEAAWTMAADPWAELMQSLASIAKQWFESRLDTSRKLLGLAYGVDDPDSAVDRVVELAESALGRGVETDVLVRLQLLFIDLQENVGPSPKKREKIIDAIKMLEPEVFCRQLSAKQLHRLLASETRHRNEISGAMKDPVLCQTIRRMIYLGDVDGAPDLNSIRMHPLIMELPRVLGFRDPKRNYSFATDLWALVVASEDVKNVPPIALVQALYNQKITLSSLESTGWFAHWLAHWFERLSAYEAVRMEGRGVRFATAPPGFSDAQGWIQARDAVALKRFQRGLKLGTALPSQHYKPEQQRYWLAAATLKELVGLLQEGVISRDSEDEVFRQAVRRLEEESYPQHWWHLVRSGVLKLDEIRGTANSLAKEATTHPVAFELLQSAGLYAEPPSDAVISSTAQCVNCPLDTRVYLVRRGAVSVRACWDAEKTYLSEVRNFIATGAPVKGLNNASIPRFGGGLLHGFYTLVFVRTGPSLGDIRFFHPAFDMAIEFRNVQYQEKLANMSRPWLDGELVMGFLWLTPGSSDPRRTITVTNHRRSFHQIGYVDTYRDGKLQFDPARLP